MRNRFLRRVLTAILATSFVFWAACCLGDRRTSGKSLLEVFRPALAEVKAKSRIPVLLPSELQEPTRKAKYAVVEKAAANEYGISLYYELGVGDAGFAALFSAQANPGYEPKDLGNTHEVRLAGGIRGFFRAASCRGSCAPANLWWQENKILYQIQLDLRATLSKQDQERLIKEVANSAILAGPR